jgi:transposase InsO family protein
LERLEIAKPQVVKEASRMNHHKHARLTYARRVEMEMVRQMTEQGLGASEAAMAHGVTPPTARKWFGRYLTGGVAGLADASSRPVRSPRAIDPAKALLIVELRRRQMIQSRIDRSVGVSASTVSRVLARAGLSKLSDLAPAKQVVRYEHERPGDLLHIDTKKRGRIVRASHRLSGSLRDSVDSAGWEMLFVVVDDHARFAFTAMHPDEKTPQAVRSLHDAVAYFAGLGVMVSRVLSDNGAAFCSRDFASAGTELGIQHRFTRAYRPATSNPAASRARRRRPPAPR